MTRFPKGAHDDDVDSTSQALNYLRKRTHGVMEYYEREMEKEAEKYLCANSKCTNGDYGKRKKMGHNMLIHKAGASRYCSRDCMVQNTGTAA